MSDLLRRVEANAGRLDVHVASALAGTLVRNGVHGSVFNYEKDAHPDGFVSLLMPVRPQSYEVANGLIPVFQQNLPEGFLRRKVVERFGKILATDDFTLLALTGTTSIGRVHVVPSSFDRDWNKLRAIDVDAVLADRRAESLFAELLDEFVGFGVSGVLPKVLVSERATIHDAQWILKAGEAGLPSLAVNEFFTLRAATLSGIDTPAYKLSADGSVLAVRRFDQDASGAPLGFEDFCALLGLPPERKYAGTLERVFKAIDAFTTGEARVRAREGMIAAHMFSMATGNTDAHLKNYGLVYSSTADVRLAPAFDLTTTKAYPRFRNDIPAISVAGKKLESIDRTFVRFAQERAGMSLAALQNWAQRMAHGMDAALAELDRYTAEHREHREIGEAMAEQWLGGIAMLMRWTEETAASRKRVR